MALFIADYATGRLREVPMTLPDGMKPDDQPRDIAVEGLTGLRIVTTPDAPDGYRVVTLGSGVAALMLALLAVRDERFARAHTPLLLTAAALQPLGMLVAFGRVRHRR